MASKDASTLWTFFLNWRGGRRYGLGGWLVMVAAEESTPLGTLFVHRLNRSGLLGLDVAREERHVGGEAVRNTKGQAWLKA